MRALRKEDVPYSRENLETVLRFADEIDWQTGLDWYKRAHGHAKRMARRNRLKVEQTSGIIAALSPNMRWETNIEVAERVCADPAISAHFSRCMTKARRIHAGESPLSVLNGRKERAFYQNIVRPTDDGPVTVDRHACALLAGLDTPTYLKYYEKLVERSGVYDLVAGIYRDSAQKHGVRALELQAIAWELQRKLDYVDV